MTEIYTDGACTKKGRGGWAFIVVCDGMEVARACGAVTGATSQRMELRAALEALRYAERRAIMHGRLTIVSDSAYLVNCFLDGWWKKWLASGWQKSGGGKVANADLWAPIVGLTKKVGANYYHVKGHNGNLFNEAADELAVEARQLMKSRI